MYNDEFKDTDKVISEGFHQKLIFMFNIEKLKYVRIQLGS